MKYEYEEDQTKQTGSELQPGSISSTEALTEEQEYLAAQELKEIRRQRELMFSESYKTVLNFKNDLSFLDDRERRLAQHDKACQISAALLNANHVSFAVDLSPKDLLDYFGGADDDFADMHYVGNADFAETVLMLAQKRPVGDVVAKVKDNKTRRKKAIAASGRFKAHRA